MAREYSAQQQVTGRAEISMVGLAALRRTLWDSVAVIALVCLRAAKPCYCCVRLTLSRAGSRDGPWDCENLRCVDEIALPGFHHAMTCLARTFLPAESRNQCLPQPCTLNRTLARSSGCLDRVEPRPSGLLTRGVDCGIFLSDTADRCCRRKAECSRAPS